MTSSAERKALNEDTFRNANETLEQGAKTIVGPDAEMPVPFLCECPRLECTEVVLVTIPEYEAVRSDPRRGFAVAGHEDPAIENVVERTDRFLVTEKFGRAGEVFMETDERTG
jgi:hypothetical protein